MATCFRTVIVLSEDFIQELWPRVSNAISLKTSELLRERKHDDVIAMVSDPLCAIPPELFHVAKVYLDDNTHCWQWFFDLLITSGIAYILPAIFSFSFLFFLLFVLIIIIAICSSGSSSSSSNSSSNSSSRPMHSHKGDELPHNGHRAVNAKNRRRLLLLLSRVCTVVHCAVLEAIS